RSLVSLLRPSPDSTRLGAEPATEVSRLGSSPEEVHSVLSDTCGCVHSARAPLKCSKEISRERDGSRAGRTLFPGRLAIPLSGGDRLLRPARSCQGGNRIPPSPIPQPRNAPGVPRSPRRPLHEKGVPTRKPMG